MYYVSDRAPLKQSRRVLTGRSQYHGYRESYAGKARAEAGKRSIVDVLEDQYYDNYGGDSNDASEAKGDRVDGHSTDWPAESDYVGHDRENGGDNDYGDNGDSYDDLKAKEH
ncbi:MAG: hypothetical protein M1815_002346 [Lichina confinis]|nr:MAG: hypothetical protein M1815_002346 [Lichina confinis]